MSGNARSTLPARARQNPMATHDRLPAPARAWVTRAVLPWSAASVARIWRRAMIETGSENEALARLSAAEAARLARHGLAVGPKGRPPTGNACSAAFRAARES